MLTPFLTIPEPLVKHLIGYTLLDAELLYRNSLRFALQFVEKPQLFTIFTTAHNLKIKDCAKVAVKSRLCKM